MNRLVVPGKIYISASKMRDAGRGVFTSSAIKKGEIIERCPTLQIPEYESDSINQTMLVTYIYYLGENKDILTLVLGYGSIYNHTATPNAFYRFNDVDMCMEYVSLRDIEENEEITIKYDQDNEGNSNPMWFE